MSAVLTAEDPESGDDRGGGESFPCRHGRRAGLFREQERRLTHEELAVARQLASEGHDVRSLPDWARRGPTADLEVCGHPVEVKSFLRVGDRPGGPPTAASVCNKLLRAARQADVVVLWARGSGLEDHAVHEGLRLFADREGWSRMAAVRVLADDFDLSWGVPLRVAERPAVSRLPMGGPGGSRSGRGVTDAEGSRSPAAGSRVPNASRRSETSPGRDRPAERNPEPDPGVPRQAVPPPGRSAPPSVSPPPASPPRERGRDRGIGL